MYKHVLVPFDGTEMSQRALNEAMPFAKALGAKITLLHVLAPYHVPVIEGMASSALRSIEHQHDAETRKAAELLLGKARDTAVAGGVPCETAVVPGAHPYETIIEQAGALGADVVLMASHGRRGLQGLVLGSETVKVLTHCKVPVLVVR